MEHSSFVQGRPRQIAVTFQRGALYDDEGWVCWLKWFAKETAMG
jgi:hypothetical protein